MSKSEEKVLRKIRRIKKKSGSWGYDDLTPRERATFRRLIRKTKV